MDDSAESSSGGTGGRGWTFPTRLRRLAAPGLAFLLYFLLLDAAVETVRNGSPVRWWVTGVIVPYLGGSTLVGWRWPHRWEAVPWRTKATASLFVLLGLLAFTVWLPDGLDRGMVVLGQETAVLLCLVTATAVAATGLSLVRLEALGTAGRSGVAALAVYGMAAFLWAIPEGTSYPELFNGSGFWSWLPTWLQGSFLGGVVLLPAAFLVGVLERLLGPRERRSYPAPLVWLRRLERVVRLRGRGPDALLLRSGALVVSLTIVAGGVVDPATSSGGPGGSGTDGPSTAFDRSSGTDGNSQRSPSDGEVREPPPAAEEPRLGRGIIYPEMDSLARELGNNPAEALRFVASEIKFDPYPGSLRGARGAFLAGAANSADQALLLRDLLRLADPEADVRFAFGRLDEDEARTLVRDAAELRSPASTPPATSDAGGQSTTGPGDDAPEEVSVLLEAARTHFAAAHEDVQRHVAELDSLLADAGIQPGPIAPAVEQLVSEARSHLWLQLRRGESWVDLDPTLPDPRPGTRRVEPDSTAPRLPEHAYHHVTISVRLEERYGERSTSRYLLETDWRAPDLVGSSISYLHAEPFGLELPGSKPPPRMDRFTPLLLVDDEYGLGEPFLLPAEPPPPGSALAAAAEGMEGAMDGPSDLGVRLDDMLGGGADEDAEREQRPLSQPDEPTDAAEVATGLWLEFTFSAPGRPPETVERPIFDRVGYAKRMADSVETAPLRSLESVDGWPLPLLTIWSVATWTGEATVPNALGATDAGPEPAPGDLRRSLDHLGTLHRSYYRLRSELAARALGVKGTGVRPSEPHLSLLGLALEGTEDSAVILLDLVSGRIPGRLAASDAAAGLIWGAASLRAERLLLDGSALTVIEGVEPPNRVPDVAAVHAAARRQDVGLRVVEPDGAEPDDTPTGSAEARARVRSRLADAWTLIVPEREVDLPGGSVLGWWLVRPKAGVVLDEMENGRHQAGVIASLPHGTQEYSATQSQRRRQTGGMQRRYSRTFECGVRWLAFTVRFTLAIHAAGQGDLSTAIEHAQEGSEAAVCRRGSRSTPDPRRPRRPRRDPGGIYDDPPKLGSGPWGSVVSTGVWPPRLPRFAP